MIILDTNVISEPLRQTPEQRVIDWLDAQAVATLYLTTISVAEMRFGILALPKGRRRTNLLESFEGLILPRFAGRVLSFDVPSANAYGQAMAKARSAGRPIGSADGYIAAIAAANKMMVATRDTDPFEAAGVAFINPWDA